MAFTNCESDSETCIIVCCTAFTARPRQFSRTDSSKKAKCRPTTSSLLCGGWRRLLVTRRSTPTFDKGRPYQENPAMNARTSDASEILDMEFGQDSEYRAMLCEERVKSQAARAIYEARIAAGLTQKQLA